MEITSFFFFCPFLVRFARNVIRWSHHRHVCHICVCVYVSSNGRRARGCIVYVRVYSCFARDGVSLCVYFAFVNIVQSIRHACRRRVSRERLVMRGSNYVFRLPLLLLRTECGLFFLCHLRSGTHNVAY